MFYTLIKIWRPANRRLWNMSVHNSPYMGPMLSRNRWQQMNITWPSWTTPTAKVRRVSGTTGSGREWGDFQENSFCLNRQLLLNPTQLWPHRTEDSILPDIPFFQKNGYLELCSKLLNLNMVAYCFKKLHGCHILDHLFEIHGLEIKKIKANEEAPNRLNSG